MKNMRSRAGESGGGGPFSPARAHFLFACLVTAYFFSFFFRISASVVLPEQAARIGMGAALTGFVSSLYYYAYSVMQAVSGALHDRFGPLKVVAGGMALAAVGTGLLVFEPSAFSLGAWRLLTGIGLAPMYGGALVYQASAFSPDKYVLYSSITLSLGALGAIVSVAPLGWFLDALGLSATFAGLAGISLAMAFLLWRERVYDPVPAQPVFAHQPPRSVISRLREAFGMIVSSSYLRNLLVVWSVSAAALLSYQGLWAVSWYRTAYGVSAQEARNWASLISIGMFLGTVLLGRFWGRTEQRFRAMRFWSLFNGFSWMALLLSVAFRLPLPLSGMCGFCVGAANGLCAVHYASATKEQAAGANTGALLGTMNTVVIFVAVVFQWGTGAVISLFPGEQPGQLTSQGFLVCFSLVTLLILGSLFSLKALREPAGFTER